MTGVVAPSDLARTKAPRARLAGRVLACDAEGAVVADAFAQVVVAGLSGVTVGDLVVVRVRRDGAGLVAERLESRIAPARPDRAATGETARFTTGGVGGHLHARARALAALRAWFRRARFVEVETPARVPSPGLDLHLDAFASDDAFLVTSPEYQMKRLLVGGVPRCFQVARVWRRGEVGARHNPEFTMLEWYRAFAGVASVMADTEALVVAVARAVAGRPELTVGGVRVPLARPFERLSVAAAFERYAGVAAGDALALAASDETRFFELLVDRVEPALAALGRPVFLVDYPASQASLAREKPGDPRVCERFELYAAGVELCNGFGELTDPCEQRARLERDRELRRQRGLPVYPVDERFVAALEEGMPPSAGNAMGLDRLVALARGAASIADVIAFPEGLV